MIIEINNILNEAKLFEIKNQLKGASWIDGKVTAGHQGIHVKNNLQLEEGTSLAQKLGNEILIALEQNMTFISAALPLKVYPPMFNKYKDGGRFGNHIDNAIRQIKGTPFRVRADISATLFLSNPGEYEGGELIIEEKFGVRSIKLSAGSLILYPSGSLHRVNPVTSGERLACFFWVQSMIKSAENREILLDLDSAIQNLESQSPEALKLTGVYHNLLRIWSEV